MKKKLLPASVVALVLAVVICGIAYFGSDRIALAAMRSRPVRAQ